MASKSRSLKAAAEKAQHALFVLKDKLSGEAISTSVKITDSGFVIVQKLKVADNNTVVSEVSGDQNGFSIAIEELTTPKGNDAPMQLARSALQVDRRGEVIISGRTQGSLAAFFSLQSSQIASSMCSA
ncbi:MAG: hypothetical protein SFW65_00975 [Alphaproteobacteria bacterium]|nr:hypothetical protein [Alphaproteobacteria bacterium]